MGISELCSMLGGLSFFFYGMWMMRRSLEEVAGGRIQSWLSRMTASRMGGFFVGIVMTAALQSSSAVMVLLVGLTDAGLLSLDRVIWLILGANIGTTITGQITACAIGNGSGILAFLGILLMLSKRNRLLRTGEILGGMGVLFIGMEQMEAAMHPLGESRWVLRLLSGCSRPWTGVFAGAAFTGILQSSSAGVGVLQTMARDGLIGLRPCMYLVYGMNIGTCVTALLAAFRTKKAARSVAWLHVWINIIGTAVFVLLTNVLPLEQWIVSLAPGNLPRQIAHIHTIFNIGTSVLLFPVAERLALCMEGGKRT